MNKGKIVAVPKLSRYAMRSLVVSSLVNDESQIYDKKLYTSG